MRLRINVILITCFALFYACKREKYNKTDISTYLPYNDSLYTLFPKYKVGDCRRYGVFPDSSNNRLHKNTQKSLINSIISFAEKFKDTVYFPSGNYGANLILDSKKDIIFKFDSSEFNLVNITNEGGEESSNIKLLGTIVLYDRLGTYNSNNIKIDSVIIKSDFNKNLRSLRSRGCRIYKGSKNISIEYLEIHDLGSGGKVYQNNHAALAIGALRDSPEEISIKEVYIKSSDRHGAFISGTNIKINNITIEKYAQGSVGEMSAMQGTQKGEEFILSGLWINRCNYCEFDIVNIHTKYSKNGFPLKLDEGNVSKPTFIENLELDLKYTDTLVVDDILTNVLVKRIKDIKE